MMGKLVWGGERLPAAAAAADMAIDSRRVMEQGFSLFQGLGFWDFGGTGFSLYYCRAG